MPFPSANRSPDILPSARRGHVVGGAALLVMLWTAPCLASGSGDWSEVGPSLARVAGFLLPAASYRDTDEGYRAGVTWEGPLVFTSCDPRWCRRMGTDLGPRSNTQFSTVGALRWYPGAGTLGTRLTERFWIHTDDWGWNPALGLGAGWFTYGKQHGPIAEMRLWIGPVMYGSTTRGRVVGFFVGASAEHALGEEPVRMAYTLGFEAPIYVEVD